MSTLERTTVVAPDGTELCRWQRVPTNAAEAVVFVHGATYAGRSAFAPDGFSWLDAVAETGRAAYAPDVRGYGDSERPSELDAPADRNAPVVRATTAARDVAAAIDDVADGYDAIHLVGYSWGTIISGVALTQLSVDVDSLVQFAPIYRPSPDRDAPSTLDDDPPAFRRVTRTAARERWASQRPDGDVPEAAFEAFWDALRSSGQAVDDELIAPNGTIVDLDATIEEPLYDAAAIDVPTLVVRGSLDTSSERPDALALYDGLDGVDSAYTEIAGGSHFLQLEPNRNALYETVRSFHDRVRSERSQSHR